MCFTSEICSTDSCAPPQHLKVEWPCQIVADFGSAFFSLWATSATGAPSYSNGDGAYLYWDPSCDGIVRPSQEQQPRWIVDTDEPSMTATMDLDGDGTCEYLGHFASEEKRGVTLGNTTWKVACSSESDVSNVTIIDATVTITYVEVLPTPAPTLQPGTPCTCAPDGCAYFPYMDLDGDGCLVEAEVDKVPELAGTFAQLDENGDGCVNQTECAANLPSNSELPTFPIVGPPECDYGSYFPPGTSVCQECYNGETRRRRSEACSECPPGYEDVGEFDNCIAGVYLTRDFDVGDTEVYVNGDFDETGHQLTVGDGITVLTRNPKHFERFVITGKHGFDEVDATGSRRVSSEEPFFEVDHPTHEVFKKYDIVISACTKINGIDLSGTYPCGCGKDVCALGERCDEQCPSENETMEVYDSFQGLNWGKSGCCIRPAQSPMPTPVPTVQAVGDPHLVNLQGEHFDINHEGDFVLLRIPQDDSRPVEMELRATIRPEHGKPCTTYITQVELSGYWFGDQSVQVRSYLRSHSGADADQFLGMRVLNRTADSEAPWQNITDWTDEAEVVFEGAGNSTDEAEVVFEGAGKSDFRVTLSKMQWFSNKRAGRGSPTVAGQFLVRVQNKWQDQSAAEIKLRQDLPGQEHLNVAVRHLGALGRADIGGLLGFDSHPTSLEDITPECQRHRDGLDGKKGPRPRATWKTRWEKLKQQRAQADDMKDNEAASSLIITGRDSAESTDTDSKMCVCPSQELIDRADEGDDMSIAAYEAEGVVADFQIGRLAEASWD
jgi:hypothetical protein